MTIAYYLVIGRIIGDDEDTPLTYEFPEPADVNEVMRLYREDMLTQYVDDPDDNDAPMVVVNRVFVSDKPIVECWNCAHGTVWGGQHG